MKRTSRIMLAVFGGIGLAFLCIGLVMLFVHTNAQQNYVTVEGTIVGFTNDDTPQVVYEWNGVPYVMEGNVSSSSQSIGDPYPVMVDPSNPQNAMDSVFWVLGLVFSIIGGVFMVVGVITWMALDGGRRRREALLGYGRRVMATVTEVRLNRSVRVNNRSPYQIIAECTNPVSGQTETVKSHSIWDTALQVGDRVEVAFDPMNEKKYAFDLREEAGA